jgi:hypothetical protein
LRASDVVVDFRHIRRIGSGLGALAEYEFDFSRFNETSVLKQGPISTKIDQRMDESATSMHCLSDWVCSPITIAVSVVGI